MYSERVDAVVRTDEDAGVHTKIVCTGISCDSGLKQSTCSVAIQKLVHGMPPWLNDSISLLNIRKLQITFATYAT